MSFNQDPNAPDYAGIYAGSTPPATTTAAAPDLMSELAQMGITSLVGLTDAQLRDVATRLTAHRALVAQLQSAAPQQPASTPASPTGAPPPADPTSPDFKAQYGVPADLHTVGDISQIPGTSAADYATSQSQNMSLKDWYKYEFQKVQAAKQGTILGENPNFKATHTAQDYLQNTLQGGNLSMYGPNAGDPQKAADATARAAALQELGMSEADVSAVAGPSAATPIPVAPTPVAAPAVAPAAASPSPAVKPITQPSARQGVIDRAKAAGKTVTTASVNKTMANNAARVKQPVLTR